MVLPYIVLVILQRLDRSGRGAYVRRAGYDPGPMLMIAATVWRGSGEDNKKTPGGDTNGAAAV